MTLSLKKIYIQKELIIWSNFKVVHLWYTCMVYRKYMKASGIHVQWHNVFPSKVNWRHWAAMLHSSPQRLGWNDASSIPEVGVCFRVFTEMYWQPQIHVCLNWQETQLSQMDKAEERSTFRCPTNVVFFLFWHTHWRALEQVTLWTFWFLITSGAGLVGKSYGLMFPGSFKARK